MSVELPAGRIQGIAALPFVERVQRVGRGVPDKPVDTPPVAELQTLAAPAAATDPYGPARPQLEQLGVPEVHARGYTGAGVLVAMFDSGFQTGHPSLRTRPVVAERDYVHGDNDADLGDGDDLDDPWHGTLIWGALGGYAPGKLLGPAWGAEFVLVQSEDIRGEYPAEEDHYIAALEWADSMGVDVVSASLAYYEFDGAVSYGHAALDGQSIPVSIAVDIAVSRGMVVVNAAGNEGPGAGTIWSPVDAHGVIGVGAVGADSIITGFSSRGPTADGRLKPEVVARGLATYTADYHTNGYGTASGTSLSTPLVGGCVALLLEAHPDWTAGQVREALMATASRASSPDNTYGHGLVNLSAAIDREPPAPPRRPLPFRLLEPVEEAIAEPVITFRWESAENPAIVDPVQYALLFAADSMMAHAETLSVGTDTTLTLPADELPRISNRLYWTVRASNTAGFDRLPYFPFRLQLPDAAPEPGATLQPRLPDPGSQPSPDSLGVAARGAEDDPNWWHGFNRGELNGPVHAITLLGDGNQVAVAGEFQTGSSHVVGNVARWDGIEWQAYGPGLSGDVRELAEYQGELVAGGLFASEYFGYHNLARWDESVWAPVTGWHHGEVVDLEVIGSHLWAAGPRIVRHFDGSAWHQVGPPAPVDVRCFAVGDGDTVFASQDAVYWLGPTQWVQVALLTSVPAEEPAGIVDIMVHEGRLWIAGGFDRPQSGLRNLATLDGANQWTPIPGGSPNGPVRQMKVIDGNVYIAGDFTEVGGVPASGIAALDGQTWQAVGDGLQGSVHALVQRPTGLFAGGDFASSGTTLLDRTAMFENGNWQRPGQGLSHPDVLAMRTFGDRLIVAGSFPYAAGMRVNGIAAWDGARWHRMGSGANSEIWALEEHDGALVVGGGFTMMDGAPASRVVSWNGESWSSLGSGFDQPVFALQSFNDTLYAAGAFERSGENVVHHVARWDGAAWRPVGEGFDSWVTDLEVYDGQLVACGFFNHSGTDVAPRVAAWTGGKWESLGATMRVYESVRAMTVFDGRLVATGNFHVLGGVNATNIAAWNGSSWGVISSGFVVCSGQAVVGVGTRLFVAGGTVYPEGVRIPRIHQWNGTYWVELASAPTGGAKHITALAEFQGSLYVGGTFERLPEGAATHFLARYDGLDADVPVRLASFTAQRVDAGVAVQWEIAGEPADVAGFHVHRDDGNGLVRLTNSLLSGSRKYEHVDQNAPAGTLRYQLEAVLRSGEREWFGPIQAADPVGTPPPPLGLSGAPNPFSDRTMIALSLPAAGPVRLEAFDAAGRGVTVVHDGVLSEGAHELSWDGRATNGARLPSGIYFLRLTSRDGSVSRKVVLAR